MSERSFATIRSPFTMLVLAYVQARGRDVGDFAARHGISPVIGPLDPIPTTRFAELMESAERELGEPYLGLRVATSVQRACVLDYATRSAPDVRAALDRVIRYQRLFSDRLEVAAEITGTDVIVSYRLGGIPLHAARHSYEYSIAALAGGLRQLAPDATISRVMFPHACPAQIAELVAFFGTDQIEFGCETAGFVFPARTLDQPIASADPALLAVLDAHASLMLENLPIPTDFVGTVRDAVRKDLLNGTPEIGEIAQKLHMSARTLQRRLAEHDTAFQDVVDSVRHELAERHLRDESLAIGEVAYLLGYSDSRAFLRAFKRWTNTTPGEYRERHARAS